MQHFYYASGQDEFYLVLINTFTNHQDKMNSFLSLSISSMYMDLILMQHFSQASGQDEFYLVLINIFTKHQDKMNSILSLSIFSI